MEEKKNFNKKKAGFLTAVTLGVISLLVIVSNTNNPVLRPDDNGDSNDAVEEWHMKQRINSWDAVGENNPGNEGWLSTFILDYGEVPETVLANNATDWSTDATACGYVDTDNTAKDLKSEDPGFFVVRVKYDTEALDGGSWNWSRYRVNLTVSGDETISGVGELDNSSSAGDAVISASNADNIYINFWWDDGVDGYRITDDGTIAWSIVIWEKY